MNRKILKQRGYSCKVLVFLLILLAVLFIPAETRSEVAPPLEEFLIITESGMDLSGVFTGENKGHICSRYGIIHVGPEKVCIPDFQKKKAREAGYIGVGKLTDPDDNRVYCEGNLPNLFHVKGNLNPGTPCTIINHNPDDPLVCADDPEFPLPEEFVIPPDAEDVIVPRKGTNTISPKKYRDLILNNRSTVILKGPGTYLFRRIIAKARSKWNIKFEMEPVCDPSVFIVVNVRDFVSLAEDGCFNPKSKSLPFGIEPLYLNIAGYDGYYEGDNSCGPGYKAVHEPSGHEDEKAVFCYKGDGQVNLCRIHAPNGTVRIGGRLKTKVQVLSEWFIKTRRKCLPVRIGLMPPCCRPICPCIISHPVQAKLGQEIIVIGMAFNETTVDKILFFKSEESTAVGVGLDVDLDAPDKDAEGIAYPDILDTRKLKVEVPANLDVGERYHVTLMNSTFCAGPRASGLLLEIIPDTP